MTIKNIELMSSELSKVANTPKHYNTDFAYYLEIMSFEMKKQADNLKDLSHLWIES